MSLLAFPPSFFLYVDAVLLFVLCVLSIGVLFFSLILDHHSNILAEGNELVKPDDHSNSTKRTRDMNSVEPDFELRRVDGIEYEWEDDPRQVTYINGRVVYLNPPVVPCERRRVVIVRHALDSVPEGDESEPAAVERRISARRKLMRRVRRLFRCPCF